MKGATTHFSYSIYFIPINARVSKASAKRTSIVWQTFEVLLVKHNVGGFGHHTNMHTLDKRFFACDKQKMF